MARMVWDQDTHYASGPQRPLPEEIVEANLDTHMIECGERLRLFGTQTYGCTLAPGHATRHIACSETSVLAVWERAS